MVMNILLIRHADALPLGEGGIQDDESRPLSEQGHAQCAPLARALTRLGVRPEVVVSSPLLRARQTASGLLQAWDGTPPELRIAEEAGPDGRRTKLAKLLRGLTAETVAVVGHMPYLRQFAGWLIGGKKANLDLAKAGAAYLASETHAAKGGSELCWMLTPEICKAMAG
jgi:phosphohistidine phosphatase